MTYLLDANVFIDAFHRYYAFDIAPGFWDSLISLAQTRRVLSIDRVLNELLRTKDELCDWVQESFHGAFQSTDRDDVFSCYGQAMQWVNDQIRYSQESKSRFAEGADGWLVAYARACNCTVVTLESYDHSGGKKVKLPNVCEATGIQYINTFELLQQLGVCLICNQQ